MDDPSTDPHYSILNLLHEENPAKHVGLDTFKKRIVVDFHAVVTARGLMEKMIRSTGRNRLTILGIPGKRYQRVRPETFRRPQPFLKYGANRAAALLAPLGSGGGVGAGRLKAFSSAVAQ